MTTWHASDREIPGSQAHTVSCKSIFKSFSAYYNVRGASAWQQQAKGKHHEQNIFEIIAELLQ